MTIPASCVNFAGHFRTTKYILRAQRQEATDLVGKDPVPVAIVDLGLPPDPDGASEGLAILAEILCDCAGDQSYYRHR